MSEENTHQIGGQPVSEYGYLTYQFWKDEKNRLTLVFLTLVVCNAAIFCGAALVVVSYFSHTQCEVQRGTRP